MNETLPYQEVKQTPYVVFCTTGQGGHLSWFEIDGHRWHARPLSNSIQCTVRCLLKKSIVYQVSQRHGIRNQHRQEFCYRFK